MPESSDYSPRSWRAESGYPRLDLYVVKHHPELSRSFVARLIRDHKILVNDGFAHAASPLSKGDKVSILASTKAGIDMPDAGISIPVLYEDASILVVDKPSGLTVHPGAGPDSATLSGLLASRYPELAGIGEPGRPGIVHRLDKDTSGLMVIARNENAYRRLVQMFKNRLVKKSYMALLLGRLTPEKGCIDAPVGRHPSRRQVMAIVDGGRPAITRYRVTGFYGNWSLVEAVPETGRTHQIRVHFAAIGFPVAGDRVYGSAIPGLGRQFLHAAKLDFAHPDSGNIMAFHSPLPADLSSFLNGIQTRGGSLPEEPGD
jgi:23S rRNA pseudouridine1911/1915/1917 synthase